MFTCSACDFKSTIQSEWDSHLQTGAHRQNMRDGISKLHTCKKCKFGTTTETKWIKHKNTISHKNKSKDKKEKNTTVISKHHVECLPNVDNIDYIIREIQTAEVLKDIDAIYVFRLVTNNAPEGYSYYKYGITYRFNKRPDENRKRFGCDMLMIVALESQLSRCKLETIEHVQIPELLKRTNMLKEYCGSKETFIANNEQIDDVIKAIKKLMDHYCEIAICNICNNEKCVCHKCDTPNCEKIITSGISCAECIEHDRMIMIDTIIQKLQDVVKLQDVLDFVNNIANVNSNEIVEKK